MEHRFSAQEWAKLSNPDRVRVGEQWPTKP